MDIWSSFAVGVALLLLAVLVLLWARHEKQRRGTFEEAAVATCVAETIDRDAYRRWSQVLNATQLNEWPHLSSPTGLIGRTESIIKKTRYYMSAACALAKDRPEAFQPCAIRLRSALGRLQDDFPPGLEPLAPAVSKAVRETERILSIAGDKTDQAGPSGAASRGLSVLQPWADMADNLEKTLEATLESSFGGTAGYGPGHEYGLAACYQGLLTSLRELAQELQRLSSSAEQEQATARGINGGAYGKTSPREQLAKLLEALAGGGFLEIRPAPGQPLVPVWHEVVADFPAERPADVNTVKRCLTPGYEWFGQLLLAARVEAWCAAPEHDQRVQESAPG